MAKTSKHSSHLCALMETCDGIESVIHLVLDPRFVCKRCARSARKKKNLCRPIKISSLEAKD